MKTGLLWKKIWPKKIKKSSKVRVLRPSDIWGLMMLIRHPRGSFELGWVCEFGDEEKGLGLKSKSESP